MCLLPTYFFPFSNDRKTPSIYTLNQIAIFSKKTTMPSAVTMFAAAVAISSVAVTAAVAEGNVNRESSVIKEALHKLGGGIAALDHPIANAVHLLTPKHKEEGVKAGEAAAVAPDGSEDESDNERMSRGGHHRRHGDRRPRHPEGDGDKEALPADGPARRHRRHGGVGGMMRRHHMKGDHAEDDAAKSFSIAEVGGESNGGDGAAGAAPIAHRGGNGDNRANRRGSASRSRRTDPNPSTDKAPAAEGAAERFAEGTVKAGARRPRQPPPQFVLDGTIPIAAGEGGHAPPVGNIRRRDPRLSAPPIVELPAQKENQVRGQAEEVQKKGEKEDEQQFHILPFPFPPQPDPQPEKNNDAAVVAPPPAPLN